MDARRAIRLLITWLTVDSTSAKIGARQTAAMTTISLKFLT